MKGENRRADRRDGHLQCNVMMKTITLKNKTYIQFSRFNLIKYRVIIYPIYSLNRPNYITKMYFISVGH